MTFRKPDPLTFRGRDLVSLGGMDSSLFLIDRERVRLETLNLIRRAGANRCPLFLPSYFEAQVKKLPKMVEIGVTPGWRFLNCTIHGPAVAWECYENGQIVVDFGQSNNVG